MTAIAWIFAILLCVAIGLIAVGLRGYRAGDHPVCRRCGFDLFGKPADTVICGECGSSLTAPRSVVIGRHRRRSRFIVSGLVILLPTLSLAAVVIWGRVNAVNWLKYVPVSWLVKSAGSTNPSERSPALAELIARAKANELTAGQMTSIVEVGLAYQGDLSKPWDTGWGDLLEWDKANGKLTQQQWLRYAAQTWPGGGRIEVRSRVRLGDPLCYSIDASLLRTSAANKWLIKLRDLQIRAADGEEVKIKNQSRSSATYTRSASTEGEILAADFPPGLKPGSVTLHFVASVIVGPNAGHYEPQPLAQGTLDLPGTFTLLPSDQSTVAVVHDSSLTDAIKRSLTIDFYHSAGTTNCSTSAGVNGPPVGLAFDVILRSGTAECKTGSFACPAGTTAHSWFMAGVVNMPLGKTVDVVLRSNPNEAVNTIDTFQAWDGEIVFKDVPVQ